MSSGKGNCSGWVVDGNAYPITVWSWFLSELKSAVKGLVLGIHTGKVSNRASSIVCRHGDCTWCTTKSRWGTYCGAEWKNHNIPCPSSKNNKWHQQERNSEDLGETKKTDFSKHKIRAHAAAWDADFTSGQDCIKVAGLWRKKLSCMVRKMYHRRILIINYPLSDNCAKKISANKGWLKQVLQLLLTLTAHAIVLN